MSRVYEVMFIVRPDVEDEEADKLIAGFSSTVTNGGGQVKSVEKMGRRKLAYMVRKFNDGNFVLMTVEANGAGNSGIGAPSPRDGAGDQVHHRAHRRRGEAVGEGEVAARRAPQSERRTRCTSGRCSACGTSAA